MDVVDGWVGMSADTILISTYSLAGKDWAVGRCEAELLLEVLIDLVGLVWPSNRVSVGLTLMDEEALDLPAFVDSLMCEGDEALPRLAVIAVDLTLHPVGLNRVAELSILVKKAHRTTVDAYLDDAYRDVLREVLKEGAAEVVGRRDIVRIVGTWAAVAWLGRAPLTDLAVFLIGRCKVEEALRDDGVLWLNDAFADHIRLADAEIEILFWLRLLGA